MYKMKKIDDFLIFLIYFIGVVFLSLYVFFFRVFFSGFRHKFSVFNFWQQLRAYFFFLNDIRVVSCSNRGKYGYIGPALANPSEVSNHQGK